MKPALGRIGDRGWLVLIGGGEFSFEETDLADAAWLAKLDPEASIGFVPAASGSEDYANHFGVYLEEYFERRLETLPIYRARDARRGKNAQRLDGMGGVYLGGGVADHLVEALLETVCLEAMARCLDRDGTVVAIAAGAQALGHTFRGLFGGKMLPGLNWLKGGVVETNFDASESNVHRDRRLRRLVTQKGVRWGLGIPAGSAVLIAADGGYEVLGDAWWLGGPDEDLIPLSSDRPELAEFKV